MAKKTSPESSDAPPAACLVFGPDSYRNDETARALVETICPPEERLFGAEQVDGRVETADEAVAALRNCLQAITTRSFLGHRKVVWFREAAFLKNDRIVRSAEVQRWLNELIALVPNGIPPGHFLILTAPEVDGRSALYRAFKQGGRIVDHRPPARPREAVAEMLARAQEALAKAGVRADDAAAAELAARVGADAATLAQEAEKLAAWAGERGTIGVEDVRRLTPLLNDTAIWALTDALRPGATGAALRALSQLLAQGESPIALVAALESHFRELAVLRECADRGWVRVVNGNALWSDGPEVDAALSALEDLDPRKIHPYRAGRLMEKAALYPPKHLGVLRDAILSARERMVSSAVRPALLLEWLVVRLCEPVPRAAAGGERRA